MEASLKTDDDISISSVCKMIATDRRNARKVKRKNMYIDVFKEDGYTLYSVVCVYYNPGTDNCGISSAKGLKYNGMMMYPGIHQKRRCVNKNGIDAFLKRRVHSRKWWRENGKKWREKNNNNSDDYHKGKDPLITHRHPAAIKG